MDYHPVTLKHELPAYISFSEYVSLDNMAKLLEAIVVSRLDDPYAVEQYSGLEAGFEANLELAAALGVVESTDDKAKVNIEGIYRGVDKEFILPFIKKSLYSHPFISILIEGLSVPEPYQQALHRTCLTLKLSQMHYDYGVPPLLRLACECDILEKSDNEYKLSKTIEISEQERIITTTLGDVDGEAKAKLELRRLLGKETHDKVPANIAGDLSYALLNYKVDHEKSVNKVGKAIENLLRHLAKELGLHDEAKGQNGIGGLTSVLLKHKKILKSHELLLMRLGLIRNTDSHGNDKETGKQWQISDIGALSAISAAITVVRSLYEYVENKRQIL